MSLEPKNASQRTRLRLRRSSTQRSAAGRGFTLVELLVAMTASLIVAMAVVALSKEATNTFFEETRAANSEMTLRVATDRLRADLQRAGFMSSGNIRQDALVPLDQLGLKLPAGAPISLQNLAAIRYTANGNTGVTPLSTNAANGLASDVIQISGNMGSSDQFPINNPTGAGGGCGVTRLPLQALSPAALRIQGNRDAVIRAAFQPWNPTPTARDAAGFLVRFSDDLGRSEYAVGCDAGWDAVGPYVNINTTPSFVGFGFVDGRISVNAVHTVRWEMRPFTAADTTYGALNFDTVPAASPNSLTRRYNLMRTFIDPNGLALRSDLIAEYAVDLAFSFTVDTGTAVAPLLVAYPFNDGRNTTVASGNAGAGNSPQSIRAVRARLSTRAAMADRTNAIAVTGYPIRYCLLTPCTVGQRHWARMRTLNMEVALPNRGKN